MKKEIKKKMIDNDITHKQMAEYLKISRQTWWRKLNGKDEFKMEEIKKINEILSTDILLFSP